jgi:NADPH2:quinone reductase
MRAIRVRAFGGPEVLQIEENVTLPAPAAGQVLVRVRAAGVNPVDTYIRSGAYARNPSLPYTPGVDAAGEVAAVGPEVTHLQPGDRVYVAATFGFSTGTYAEDMICDARVVHPLPESVTFAQGAALGVPYGTAWRALFQKGRVQPGETVLVHGASGAVGTAAVQMARAAGMTVVGTAGSSRGLELVAAQGAHHVFNHRTDGYREAIVRATGDRGPDVILEMLANENLPGDLAIVAPRGRVVIIGSRGPLNQFMPRAVMAKDVALLGMMLFNATAEELRPVHAAIVAGLEAGTLRPIVGLELPLAEAPRAHEAVLAAGAYGKVVLVP